MIDTTKTMDDYFNEFLLTMLNSDNATLITELKRSWKQYCNTPIITLNTNDTVVEDSGGLKTGIMSQMDMYHMGYKDGVKYAKFTKSEQPTNDNAFVWTDELVAECHEYIKGDTAGILTPYGVRKNVEMFKQSKEDNETKSANWRSENISKQSAPEPSALPNKEWEIGCIEVDGIKYYRNSSGFFFNPELHRNDVFFLKEEKLLELNHSIEAVKRLSDNTVFSVGEKIIYNTPTSKWKATINSFLIESDKMWAMGKNIGIATIDLLEKQAQPTPTQPIVEDNTDDVALFSVWDIISMYKDGLISIKKLRQIAKIKLSNHNKIISQ